MEDLGTPRSSIELPFASTDLRRGYRCRLRFPCAACRVSRRQLRRSRCCRRKDGVRCRYHSSANQEFVALDDLAAAFQLTSTKRSLGAITVSYKGKTIVLTPDQTLASVSGRLISLPAPPARSGRRWLVPVEFISRALALIYDVRLDLRKPSRLLVVGDLRVPRVTVRYDPLGAAGRLTIDATPRAVEHRHAGRRSPHDQVRRRRARRAEPAAGAARRRQGLVQAVRLVDATRSRSISVRASPASRRPASRSTRRCAW